MVFGYILPNSSWHRKTLHFLLARFHLGETAKSGPDRSGLLQFFRGSGETFIQYIHFMCSSPSLLVNKSTLLWAVNYEVMSSFLCFYGLSLGAAIHQMELQTFSESQDVGKHSWPWSTLALCCKLSMSTLTSSVWSACANRLCVLQLHCIAL